MSESQTSQVPAQVDPLPPAEGAGCLVCARRERRRRLPHNEEAERSIIGGTLFACRLDPRVARLLKPEYFFHHVLGGIYQALVELDQAGLPTDIITVAEQMRKSETIGLLRAYHGEAFLSELANDVATVENIAHHAAIVRRRWLRRRVIDIGARLVERGFEAQGEEEDLIAEATQLLLGASQDLGDSTTEDFKDVLHRELRILEGRFNRKEAITGTPSGFVDLDEMTAGFQPGHLIIIAARPSMGKTSLIGNAITHAATQEGIPALCFTLEMPPEELVERTLAAEGRINSQKLRTGFFETRDWIAITRTTDALSRAPISLNGRSYTLDDIRARAREWRLDPRRFPPGKPVKGVIVVDYLQLVQVRRSRGGNREQDVAEISRSLKLLAMQLGVPLVALSQLSRSVESRADKRPLISDMRESGAIEQDADLICSIYRDEVYDKATADKGIAEIIIGKHRGGPTGTVKLLFKAEYTLFQNLAHRPGPQG